MQNQIYRVTSKEIFELKKEFEKDESLFVIELNGHEIHELDDYFYEMYKICKFPTLPCSLGSYGDWITDLDWLEKDSYAVIINGYKDFLDWDKQAKQDVMESFTDIILPWWQEDVKKYRHEKYVSPFNVYLVED